MNPDTRLEFPIDTVPKNGTMYSINDDLHWVRMPLPMSLNHINLWLIGSKDQATLVDTGMFLDDVKTAWTDLISKEKIDIKKLIVTHMHPDHIGLAGWFVKKFNVPLCMSRTDICSVDFLLQIPANMCHMKQLIFILKLAYLKNK